MLAVNLRGSFLCAREAIKHFLAEGKPGSIVNISSVHQRIPKPSYVGYSVSKGGMQNLTTTRDDGPVVNTTSPVGERYHGHVLYDTEKHAVLA